MLGYLSLSAAGGHSEVTWGYRAVSLGCQWLLAQHPHLSLKGCSATAHSHKSAATVQDNCITGWTASIQKGALYVCLPRKSGHASPLKKLRPAKRIAFTSGALGALRAQRTADWLSEVFGSRRSPEGWHVSCCSKNHYTCRCSCKDLLNDKNCANSLGHRP